VLGRGILETFPASILYVQINSSECDDSRINILLNNIEYLLLILDMVSSTASGVVNVQKSLLLIFKNDT
jgi:hypothetical protein